MPVPLSELKVEFKVGAQRAVTDVIKELQINPGNVTPALLDNPVWLAYFYSVRAHARAVARNAGRTEKQTYARLFKKYRARPRPERPTDEFIKAEIATDPEMVAAQQALIKAEYEVDVVDGVRWAFEDRRESLRDLSADNRAQLDAEIRGAGRGIEEVVRGGRQGTNRR